LYRLSRIFVPSRFFASTTELRSSSWSTMVLIPIAPAPELSMRSGGLPPTKRGCSSWAILVDGDTFAVTVGCTLCSFSAANFT